MKKYLGLIPGIGLFFFASLAFASSVSPTTSPSFSTINVTLSAGASFKCFYLFNSSGASQYNLGSSSGVCVAPNTYLGSTFPFVPTLAPDNYTMVVLNSGGTTPAWDSGCGIGQTLSGCISYTGSSDLPTFTITAPATSTPLLKLTTLIDLTYFEQAIIYGVVIGLILGIISKAVKRQRIL